MTPSVLAKLESVLASDFDTAKNNIMVPNQDGGYHLFGLFDVLEHSGVVAVFRNSEKIQEFSTMRHAVSWCIAEKYQQLQLSTDILRLDRDYQRLKNNGVTMSAMLARIRDRARRAVARAKHDDNAWKISQLQNQLEKCVARAKYLQIRGFNDEIARTRRPAPHRTSRPGTRKPNRSSD